METIRISLGHDDVLDLLSGRLVTFSTGPDLDKLRGTRMVTGQVIEIVLASDSSRTIVREVLKRQEAKHAKPTVQPGAKVTDLTKEP